jgi:hypothetical protein
VPNPIEELRTDIRNHAQNDEVALRDLRLEVRDVRDEVGDVRDDVKALIKTQSAQTVMITNIHEALSRRARTESQKGTYKRSVKLVLWRALVPAIVGGAGYLLAHFVF